MSGTVVTELIVDARGAKEGEAVFETAMRAAGTAADKVFAQVERLRQAQTNAGTSAEQAGQKITGSATSFSAAERAANSYLARLDPVFAAQQRIGSETSAVTAALRGLDQQFIKGAVNVDQFRERQALLTGRLGEVKAAAEGLSSGSLKVGQALSVLSTTTVGAEGSSKRMQFAMRDLTSQSIDFFTQIASGGSPIRAFIQQGSQIVQVNQAMGVGFKEMAGSIGAMIARLATNPLTLFITAAVAVGAAVVAMGVHFETTQRQLASFQTSLKATRDDYNSLAQASITTAKQFANTSTASVTDALTAAKTIASTSNFSGSQAALRQLLTLSNDLAAVWDTTLPKAAEDTAKAMKDPAAAMQDLVNRGFKGATQPLADLAKGFQTANDKAQAFAVWANTVNAAASGASRGGTTDLQKALEKLSKVFNDAGTSGTSLAGAIGSLADSAAVKAVESLTTIVKELKTVVDLINNMKVPTGAQASDVMSLLSKLLPSTLLGSIANSATTSVVGTTSTSTQIQTLTDELAKYKEQAQQVRDLMAESATTVSDEAKNILQSNLNAIVSQIAVTQAKLDKIKSDSSSSSAAVDLEGVAVSHLGETGASINAWLNAHGAKIDSSIDAWCAAFVNASLAELGISGTGSNSAASFLSWGQARTGAAQRSDVIVTNTGGQFHVGSATGQSRINAAGQTEYQMTSGNWGNQVAQSWASQSQIAGIRTAGTGTSSMSGVAGGNFDWGSSIGGTGDLTDKVNAAVKLADSLNVISATEDELKEKAKAFQEALNVPGQSQATYTKLHEALDDINASLYKNVTATAASNRALAQNTSILGQDGAAAQKIAASMLELDQASFSSTGHVASLSEKQERLRLITSGLSKELSTYLIQQQRQIDASQNSLAAVEQGGQALDDYNAKVAAEAKAYDFARDKGISYQEAVAAITASNKNAAQASRDVAAAQDVSKYNKEIELITAENGLIGATVDVRNREIAVLKERQALGLKLGQQATDEQQKSIDAAAKAADLQTQYSRNTQALSDVANSISSVFDTISSAMTNSFLSGTGSAVNWKNTMVSVAQQVLAQFIKLAVINPILNSLFSTSNSTISTVASALTSSGGGSSGSSSGSSGSTSLLGSLASSLGLSSLGSSVKGLTDSIGLTGTGGLLSGVGGFLSSGIGGTSLAEASATNLAGLSSSVYSAGAPSQVTGILGGTSIGGILSGVGLAVGAGFLLSSLFSGNKKNPWALTGVGTDPTTGQLSIGQSTSQAMDSNRASIQNDIDAINSGLSSLGVSINTDKTFFSGTVGSDANKASGFDVSYANVGDLFKSLQFKSASGDTGLTDYLSGQTFSTLDDLSTAVTKYNQTVVDTRNAIDDYITSLDATIKSFTGNTGSLQQSIDSIDTSFNDTIDQIEAYKVSTSATDDQVSKLTTKENELSHAREQAIQKAVVLANQEVTNTFRGYGDRYVSAQNTLSGGGLFGERTVALQQAQTSADKAMEDLRTYLTGFYGDAYANTQDFAVKMGYLANTLGAEMTVTAKQYDDAILSAQESLQKTAEGYYVRFNNAQASLGYLSSKDAALYSFDISAQQEITAFKESLISTFGEAYKTSQSYADQLANLEKTLGEERLATAKQYDDQIISTATSAFSSITSYLQGLQANDNSILSPQQQYDLASSQFNDTLAKANSGDLSSIQNITTYADTLLNASRAINGSGTGYVTDYNRVLDALGSLSSLSVDQLTAAVFTSETRTQTQQLIDELRGVKAAVVSLQNAQAVSALAPARMAA